MKKIVRHQFSVLGLALVVAVAVFGCVFLDGYTIAQLDENGKEVYYAKANSDVLFTVNGHVECRTTDSNGLNTKLVFAILAPKDWDVANHAVVTYKCDLADDRDVEMSMSVIPESQLPKSGGGRTWRQCLSNEYGVGPNVLDDMEWVVYQTDITWNIRNNQDPTYKIFVRTKTGRRNLKCKLGFFVNHTDHGFGGGTTDQKVTFASECFEVDEGVGMTIDFCNRHFNRISPLTALQNDYVTVSYQGDVDQSGNPLYNESDIYLQGKAVTTDGKVYTIDQRNDATRMKPVDSMGKTYSITIWPAGFFGVPIDEQVDHFEYYFTNSDGSIRLTQSDDDFVQFGTPLPPSMSDRKNFNFKFECD